MFYFEFQSPHKRKNFVILCMILAVATIPHSECLGILPLKSKLDNETQNALYDGERVNKTELYQNAVRNISESNINSDHQLDETSLSDLDASSSIRKVITHKHQIDESHLSNEKFLPEKLLEDINQILEDATNETKRYKRKNNIDRIAEYPNGFDHGLIIHHHLPSRKAVRPVNPDHHYHSYPGRIPRRPEKVGPVYFGTTKPPKQQNEYYKPVLPDITPVKPHSLPPLLSPPIPNTHFQGKNYHYQFNHVQHPPSIPASEHVGFQIHHQIPFKTTTSKPFTYTPTTKPSPSYSHSHFPSTTPFTSFYPKTSTPLFASTTKPSSSYSYSHFPSTTPFTSFYPKTSTTPFVVVRKKKPFQKLTLNHESSGIDSSNFIKGSDTIRPSSHFNQNEKRNEPSQRKLIPPTPKQTTKKTNPSNYIINKMPKNKLPVPTSSPKPSFLNK